MEVREPTASELAAFRKAANALAKLGAAGLHIYLADDSLCLMAGPSHDDRTGRANLDLVRESVMLPGAGGGGW